MTSMFSDCTSLIVLDLSGNNFKTSKVTKMSNMFNNCNNIQTIYVNNSFVTTNVTEEDNVFKDCTSLVGGSGTVFDSNHINKTYAHIDGGVDNPGYFTSH